MRSKNQVECRLIMQKLYRAPDGNCFLTEQDCLDYEASKPQGYWDRVKADELPSGVDFCTFDWAVNSGSGRAAKALQRAVQATPDGAVGPMTLAAVKDADAEEIIKAIAKEREEFYRSLRTFETFGKGWLRRNEETRDFALEMV